MRQQNYHQVTVQQMNNRAQLLHTQFLSNEQQLGTLHDDIQNLQQCHDLGARQLSHLSAMPKMLMLLQRIVRGIFFKRYFDHH